MAGNFISNLISGAINGLFGEPSPSGTSSNDSGNSIFSALGSKDVISAGITAAASLFSGLYGTNLDQDKLDEIKRQYDSTLALQRDQLEQQKLLAEEQIAASKENAAAMAGASRFASMVNLAGAEASSANQSANRLMAARAGRPELTLQGRGAQTQAAEATGKLGIDAFANLIGAAQRPLLR